MYWHGVTRGSGRPHTIRLTLLINATTLRVFGERKVAKGLNNYVLTRLQGGANRAEPTVLARRSRSSKWISKIAAAFPEDIKQRNHPASSSDAFPKVRFASMKKGWVLTQELFDTLLGWLDPDRERAGDKYETVRIRLIKVFTCRGCAEAEELADETINRVASKLSEIINQWEGDPALYFYKVAQYVFAERQRTESRRVELPAQDPPATEVPETDGLDYECLLYCLEQLRITERTLVVDYYQHRGQAKIRQHEQMAIAMGIAINALRIRACRIRRQLKKCVEECIAAREQRNAFSM
jgi:DNA-directed RNA polymerase specialized sigma24 family protein